MSVKIAEFEKVSFERFSEDMSVTMPDLSVRTHRELYEGIKLPQRATAGSAGYDFYLPVGLPELLPDMTITVPTGIRVKIDDGWVLMCCPRSGLGFKYRMRLNNTVGIIDSDYYGAANEGHIMIRITNESNSGKIISLKSGDAFVQGIFLPYGITYSDNADGIRIGGFGSTS